jgi:hypothetical protein
MICLVECLIDGKPPVVLALDTAAFLEMVEQNSHDDQRIEGIPGVVSMHSPISDSVPECIVQLPIMAHDVCILDSVDTPCIRHKNCEEKEAMHMQTFSEEESNGKFCERIKHSTRPICPVYVWPRAI